MAERVLARAAASGTPIIAVPYGCADVERVRAYCARALIPVVAAPVAAAFGAAANAGAAATSSSAIAFVDGAEASSADWQRVLLAVLDDAGVAGPCIRWDDGTRDECGMLVSNAPLSLRGFDLQSFSSLRERAIVDVVPRDCIVTKRMLFDELGGFAEDLGSALEVIDYCLRASERGERMVCEPAATFIRRAPADVADAQRGERERAFAERWRERAEPHENLWPEVTGSLIRRSFHNVGILAEYVPVPEYRVLVHGDAEPSREFVERIFNSRLRPAEVLWAAPGGVPAGARACGDAVETARALTEVRGADCVAFVRSDTVLAPDWLNELVNAIERAPDTVAATIDGDTVHGAMPASADARCTLVAPRLVPQHLRIEPAVTFDAALAGWLAQSVDAGRAIARAGRTATRPGPAGVAIPAAVPAGPGSDLPFASIVMLSWNAPGYTEGAVASIRASRTAVPYEIIIVDNGSGAATLARLRNIDGIQLIENAVNTGFAFACNQGLAAGRGTHLVLLNNDVIVTDGWLDALIAVQRANPTVGASAPRTNRIAGAQQIDDVPYGEDLAGLAAFAQCRAHDLAGSWTREFRVVGFCMCLDRRVIEEIGGLDPHFGTGNFEDDDFCMRIRAAGYDIAVCEDAFIHHFGSVSFRENKVDYNAVFARNKALFAKRWNVTYAGDSYDARYPFRRGFVRARDFVPLPPAQGVGRDWLRPA
jgi:GT2 family glycosyltransferase